MHAIISFVAGLDLVEQLFLGQIGKSLFDDLFDVDVASINTWSFLLINHSILNVSNSLITVVEKTIFVVHLYDFLIKNINFPELILDYSYIKQDSMSSIQT